jgi:hypothetical protein
MLMDIKMIEATVGLIEAIIGFGLIFLIILLFNIIKQMKKLNG